MTAFNALVAASGLSHREAAGFLAVSLGRVQSWSSGRRNAPSSVLREMRSLVSRQNNAAASTALVICARAAGNADPIDIAAAASDIEAQKKGWPCVSAQQVVLGRAISLLPLDVAERIVLE